VVQISGYGPTDSQDAVAPDARDETADDSDGSVRN
jgi:hypothetical protein